MKGSPFSYGFIGFGELTPSSTYFPQGDNICWSDRYTIVYSLRRFQKGKLRGVELSFRIPQRKNRFVVRSFLLDKDALQKTARYVPWTLKRVTSFYLENFVAQK